MNTWTELDCAVLRCNIRNTRNALNERTQLMAVVKSNAYGHGLKPVAEVAWSEGVRWFVTAYIEEGVQLRETYPEAHILMVGILDPADVAEASRHNMVPVLANEDHARALADQATALPSPLVCHAKIDTGMGRLGLPWETAAQALSRMATWDGLDIQGLCSHFACGDHPDPSFTHTQLERFQHVRDRCEDQGIHFAFHHLSNSGGLLQVPDADSDGVRPGILLYGYPPALGTDTPRVMTSPCLQWKTRLRKIQTVPAGSHISYDSTFVTDCEMPIGILDVGYADGYPRLLSNTGRVLIRGAVCPVVGRVTMNMTVVDLRPCPPAQVDDEVVLMGQQGAASVWADHLASACQTIAYEILTGIRTSDRRVIQAPS